MIEGLQDHLCYLDHLCQNSLDVARVFWMSAGSKTPEVSTAQLKKLMLSRNILHNSSDPLSEEEDRGWRIVGYVGSVLL